MDALEIRYRTGMAGKLPDHRQLLSKPIRDPPGTAHITAHIDAVAARFQHIAVRMTGDTGIVIGRKLRRIDGKMQHFVFAGIDDSGFLEGYQITQRLAQLALGRVYINLHHFRTGQFTGVGHRHIQAALAIFLPVLGLQAEGGIA